MGGNMDTKIDTLLNRQVYLDKVNYYLGVQPICAILGARQVGKTSLARQFAEQYSGEVEFFDLENPTHLATLETPMLTLSQYPNCLVVIDEIQRRPDLFPILRVLVDDPERDFKFLILGSASRDLIRQSSETLAGRIGYIDLPPFTLNDVDDASRLLIRGGFPRSYLAQTDQKSFSWREEYVRTFLERDLPSFGFDVPAELMHRFWMMLCFYHGQQFNAHEVAHSLMIADKTVRRYLDILADTFMVRILQPWFENIKKRQVRGFKIYFRDSGIFNTLAGNHSLAELAKSPKIGALWEGFALETVINCLQFRSDECYFWATQNDAELDLLAFKNGKRFGFEFKYTDSPKMTKSMGIALNDLGLEHLYVIFPGDIYFPMSEKVTGCGLDMLKKIVLKA